MSTSSLFGPRTLLSIYRTFEDFGSGKSGSKLLSQAQFEKLCTEMGLINSDWSERLFAAIDEDVTGALDIYEFLSGLRIMCDMEAEELASKRYTFAFRMFDLDRGGTLQPIEIKEFIKNFFKVSKRAIERWIGEVTVQCSQ